MQKTLSNGAAQVADSMLSSEDLERIDWVRSIPFISIHLACLLVSWSGASWIAVAVCLAFMMLRMFGLTGGYHRYFSHRSYKTSRFFQFLLAFLGGAATQKGALWWAAHHRRHHRYSDTENDVHSPVVKSFLWAHVGWIMSKKYNKTNIEGIRDFAQFPELRFLDRHHWVPPILLAVSLFGLGAWLRSLAPQLGTSGFQMLVWGFVISTVALYHSTFLVNSLAHVVGRQRFETKDESRNNFWIALVTMGEGWHNNHHRHPSSERNGFYWWEIDMTHYILKMLSWVRIVWDLREPPEEVYTARETKEAYAASQNTDITIPSDEPVLLQS